MRPKGLCQARPSWSRCMAARRRRSLRHRNRMVGAGGPAWLRHALSAADNRQQRASVLQLVRGRGHATRAGEAESIREMIERVADLHRIDRSRIYVTGLSAGGAMAATMLAIHPEIFAGGAIIAGLPHGVAAGVPQALERMRGQGLPSSAALEELVRKASHHAGPWPRLQVWHGTADAVVVPANGEAIIAQWRPLHGLAAAADRQEIDRPASAARSGRTPPAAPSSSTTPSADSATAYRWTATVPTGSAGRAPTCSRPAFPRRCALRRAGGSPQGRGGGSRFKAGLRPQSRRWRSARSGRRSNTPCAPPG